MASPVHRLAAASLLFLLTACGGSGALAPVGRSPDAASGRVHAVQRGETLYSIAWRYRADYRDLAALNGIPPPYVIHPGRKLRIDGVKRAAGPRRTPRRSRASRNDGRPDRSRPTASKRSDPRPRPPAVTAGSATKPSRADRGRRGIAWRWPTAGKVLSTFRQSGNTGLDIGGRRGQPIKAAATGRVVYGGSGLLGYGKLIIIKHDKRFLSAYAHNNKLLVAEGDQVAVGERIAEMGDTGTDRVMLHFEIRRDGKPVDPARYLSR